eukprot:Blabericola_migrator_1__6923@NODE_3508_length_1719_cov_6_239104_g2178_i0_p2_GENE_NODE_3508_length_1719_cov_6_239104_g2178_i0NODE_3508_length_1719_cov_6_239104_g2178_i0_p2_ORF_typecomplete_len103_score11_51_NODE_3508_length_1719_cov_6_239104_g2178_i0169477
MVLAPSETVMLQCDANYTLANSVNQKVTCSIEDKGQLSSGRSSVCLPLNITLNRLHNRAGVPINRHVVAVGPGSPLKGATTSDTTTELVDGEKEVTKKPSHS